jgi:hypothetical protein
MPLIAGSNRKKGELQLVARDGFKRLKDERKRRRRPIAEIKKYSDERSNGEYKIQTLQAI